MRHADSRRLAAGLAAAFGLLRQAFVVVLAVAVYFGVRGLTEGNPDVAVRNAGKLVAVERALRLDWESWLQDGVLRSPVATTVSNWIYIYGHWPVIAVALFWFALRHPAVFMRTRDAMLASGAVGMIVFAVLPIAPPRLAGLGLVDTITERSNSYRVLQPAAFTNQYAALPSLHVGWNLIISLAVLLATRNVVLRILAVAMTVAMDAAVVITANHYVLDILSGAVLAVVAWLLVEFVRRRVLPGDPVRVEEATAASATGHGSRGASFRVPGQPASDHDMFAGIQPARRTSGLRDGPDGARDAAG